MYLVYFFYHSICTTPTPSGSLLIVVLRLFAIKITAAESISKRCIIAMARLFVPTIFPIMAARPMRPAILIDLIANETTSRRVGWCCCRWFIRQDLVLELNDEFEEVIGCCGVGSRC